MTSEGQDPDARGSCGLTKGFVLGLILGIVIGGFAGAFLPTLMEGYRLPHPQPAPKKTASEAPPSKITTHEENREKAKAEDGPQPPGDTKPGEKTKP